MTEWLAGRGARDGETIAPLGRAALSLPRNRHKPARLQAVNACLAHPIATASCRSLLVAIFALAIATLYAIPTRTA